MQIKTFKKNMSNNIKLYLKTSDIISVYITTILGITLYLLSVTLLYPLGIFYKIIAYLIFLSITGILLVYKKPKIAEKLFVTNVVGTFLTILVYIFTTNQDWKEYTFIFVLLTLSCLLLLLPIYLLRTSK